MPLNMERFRREIHVSEDPPVHISAIDINPKATKTILFLHGYGGKATQWKFQLRDFSKTHRVIALDMRGHGKSDRPRSSYSMSELLSDVEKCVSELGIKAPFVLVGHSYGGAIASEYAKAHPKDVSQLVLIATPGEFHLRRYYRFLLSLPYSLHIFIAPFVRNWVGAPPGVMKSIYYNSLKKWSGWATFGALQTPTLFIRGKRDRVFAAEQFERVLKTIPGVEDLTVRSAGHLCMLQRHKLVSNAIKDFIQSGRSS